LEGVCIVDIYKADNGKTYFIGVDLNKGKVLQVGTKIKITDSMDNSWICKEAEITKVVSTNPICYELNIGGGHWLNSCLEEI
jgi:hypothetical protein